MLFFLFNFGFFAHLYNPPRRRSYSPRDCYSEVIIWVGGGVVGANEGKVGYITWRADQRERTKNHDNKTPKKKANQILIASCIGVGFPAPAPPHPRVPFWINMTFFHNQNRPRKCNQKKEWFLCGYPFFSCFPLPVLATIIGFSFIPRSPFWIKKLRQNCSHSDHAILTFLNNCGQHLKLFLELFLIQKGVRGNPIITANTGIKNWLIF